MRKFQVIVLYVWELTDKISHLQNCTFNTRTYIVPPSTYILREFPLVKLPREKLPLLKLPRGELLRGLFPRGKVPVFIIAFFIYRSLKMKREVAIA